MKYAIITQTLDSGDVNPGTQFIHRGIRYMIKQVDPDARFFTVCQDEYIQEEWDCVKNRADVLIIGGGPRLNSSPKATCFCDWDVWSYISMAMDWGIPVWDLSVGATYYLPLPTDPKKMALRMIGIPKVMQILTYYPGVSLATTRDPVMQEMLRVTKIKSTLLPCVSYWSRHYWDIKPVEKKYNVVVIRRLPGHEHYLMSKIMTAFEKLHSEKETKLLAHVQADADWFREGNHNLFGSEAYVEVVNDPKLLMKFYTAADKVISFRLHGSVMGLSMGAKVLNVAIDSGSFCMDQFAVQSIYFTDLRKKEIPLDKFQEISNTWEMSDYKQKHLDLLRGAIDVVQTQNRNG